MASSQKKAVIPGIVEWESSHIDNLVIHELLKLAEQDLKQQKLISRALHSQKYSNVDEKDLLAAIVTDDWIEGVIFRKEGKRYIIEKDIYLHSEKGRLYQWYKLHTDVMNRHHYVGPSHRALKYIDRTSEKKIALRKSIAIYQQKIEDSWALPQSDCHHFLKFPQEIIEQILGYLVKVPAAAVAPGVVTCNWKKFWVVVSSFVICKESREDCHSEKAQDFISPYDPSVIPKSTKGEDGRLTVLRRVHEAALDACVLRVCRSFSNIGGNLLYGRNRYTFRMNNGSLHGSPPTWIGKERWRPPAGKPYLKGREHSATGFYNRINRGITDIQKHVAIKNLAGWVFHDPFLRFLYTIATENTTLIQTLEFSGEVHCHRCETGHFCDDCIFDSLRVYIPFINALCPKVRKLTLSVRGDFEDDENVVFDQRSVQFFQEARQLKYITELVVRDLEPRDSGMMPTTASILAEPTIKYFNDRVVAWNK